MNRILQALILFGGLAAFLVLVNMNILSTEQQLADGEPLYLRLAPVDPRSLIQGDYMVLDYALARDATLSLPDYYEAGKLVARVDEQRVLHFERFYQEGEPIADDERVLRYRLLNNQVVVGVRSFFFQEGLAPMYEDAVYADVRVTGGGGVLLFNLVGEQFNDLLATAS